MASQTHTYRVTLFTHIQEAEELGLETPGHITVETYAAKFTSSGDVYFVDYHGNPKLAYNRNLWAIIAKE